MEVERCLDSLHRVTGKKEGGTFPNHSSGTEAFPDHYLASIVKATQYLESPD
jgi:hypothetical protein